jgi:iron complex transport system substrate-binding protein
MKRIISLLPSATEIVCALGAGDALVGITHECDYPTEILGRPRVTSARIDPTMASEEIDRLVREQLDDSGTLYRLDLDLVERLEPDIVLTQQLCTVCAVGYETVHAAMRSLERPPEVVNLEPRTLAEAFESFMEVARLLGVPDRGETLLARLRDELDAIPELDPKPKVLLLEWLEPPFAAGHWIPELVEAAGAEPVLHFKGTHSRQVDSEAIEGTEMDVLAISCCGFSVERTMRDVPASAQLRELRRSRPEITTIILDGNHFFSRPGPRLVESARLLSAALRGIPIGDSSQPVTPFVILPASATNGRQ